jgi:hypothetical protein
MTCTEPPRDILDWLGGWLAGDYNASEDFWVSTGFESEADHPERYRWNGDRYCIRDKEVNPRQP